MFVRNIFLLLLPTVSWGLDLTLPTANHAIYEPDGEPRFFQGTAGHDWHSGQYGPVRSGGQQYHEGIDIRYLEHDRRGEPTDQVLAVADGELAYMATIGGASNYGRYALIRHRWNSVEIYSLYAHLASFAPNLRTGQKVKKGDWIAIMGHSGTQKIPTDRSHLHLEICFQINRNFANWFAPKQAKGEINEHANFNGLNLQGIDPTTIFQAAHADPNLNFQTYIETLPLAFSVLFPARKAPLSWMRAQPWCVVNGPQPSPVTAYEVWLTGEGVATLVRPRRDITTPMPKVLSVEEKNLRAFACRSLVARDPKHHGWVFTKRGAELMELLAY